MSAEQDHLVQVALNEGLVTPGQVEESRGIQRAVAEIGIQQALHEILVKKGYLTEDQVRALQRMLAEQRIGKYEILEKLGEGGAGVVYRARHATLGRIVALKVLSSKRASDPQYLEHFVREARVAVTLNHRNIVRGLDYGEADGYHYFVMEFVPGDTLYELLQREGRIEEKRALEIGIQVADALRHAREFDLSHRDLKPDNILLSAETGEAKVCDLGLAKPRRLTAGLESTGKTIGTPSYISPEQIRGIDHADTRSDIYSLGCTLYHALCGHPPFTGDSVDELLRKHLKEEARDPREIVLEISPGAAAILLKMLAKDPKQRYQSLDELIADLEAVRDGRPPIHTIAFARKGPAFGEGRGRAELARHRAGSWKIIVPVAVLLVAGGGLIAVLSGGDDGERAEPPDTGSRNSAPEVTAPPPVAGPSREQMARTALERARGFWEANPDAWGSAADRYQFVVDNYGDTPFAIDARDGRVRVLADWKKRAQESWSAVEAEVETHLAAGRFGRALASVKAFPERLIGAEGFAKRVKDRTEAIQAAATQAWNSAAASARAAAGEQRFDDALAALDPLRGCGIADIEREATAAFDRIQQERDRIQSLRQDAEAAFRDLYGRVLLALGREGYDAAFSQLARARDSEVFAHAGQRLEGASQDLARIETFQDSIRQGYDAQKGRTIAVRTADGRSQSGRLENVGRDGLDVRRGPSLVRVSWDEIPAEDRADEGLWAKGAMQAESRLDAALWLLAWGRIDLASRQLEAAASLGADTGSYEERVRLVRRARDEQVDEALRRVDVHLLEGRLDDARKTLDETVAFAPDHAHARYRRGLVLAKLRRAGEALADLQEALRLGETEPRIHFEIARLLETAERFPEALEAYNAFLGTSPQGDDAEVASRRRGELRARLSEGQAKSLRAKGEAALRKRVWEEALQAYEEADRLIPDDPGTVLGIARAAEELKQILRAYVTYRRFLDLRPQGNSARDARKAMGLLEETYREPKKEALGAFQQGEDFYRRGKYDEAIDNLDRAVEAAPLNVAAYYNRAYSWYAKGLVSGSGPHIRAGLEDFERVIQLEPGSPDGYVGRALCWIELHRPEEALEDAKRAIQIKEDGYLQHQAAANACIALERLRDAKDHLDRAIALSPDQAVLHVSLAKVLWRLDDLDGALAELERAGKCNVTAAETGEIRDLRRQIERQKEDTRR